MRLINKLLFFVGVAFALVGCKSIQPAESEPVYSVNEISYVKRANTAEQIDQKFKFQYEATASKKFIIGTASEFNFKVVQVDENASFDNISVVVTNSNFKAEHIKDEAGESFKDSYVISYSGKDLGTINFEIQLMYRVDENTSIVQDTISLSLVEQSKTLWDWVIGILNSAVGTTLSVTALITVLWRSAIGIYNKGKTDKKELVTKQEMKDFEADTRKDMRGYVRQITDTVTDSSMRIIEKELKPLDDIMSTANEMKIMKVNIDNNMKLMNERYDDIKQISDTVRSLSSKVTRIEYGKENANERRSEK